MRQTPNAKAEQYREMHPMFGAGPVGSNVGWFKMGGLSVMAHDGIGGDVDGWEHVSVSRPDRVPTWEEMCLVKDVFWGEEEVVIQIHPKKSEYVNRHPYVLHLWRRVGENIETPPKNLV